MKSLLYFISIPVGFVAGGIAGVAGSIYLLFFFSIEQLAKTVHSGTYWPILSYLLLLLCSKVIIFLVGVLGAILGCVPGCVGLAHKENKSH